jgi:phage terminase Nu1 subunit (DNA packaging protein)
MTAPIKALQKKDIAEALGCSIRQVEIMIQNGTVLKPTHIGGMVRWHPDMFRKWFDDRFRNQDGEDAREVSEQKIETEQRAPKLARVTSGKTSAVKRMFARQTKNLNFA